MPTNKVFTIKKEDKKNPIPNMAENMAELRLAVASVSLGRAAVGHSLIRKIEQAALHSFRGIEVFYECLEYHARSLPSGLNNANLEAAAKQVREACRRYSIAIVCLQPFPSAEGLLDQEERRQMLQRMKLWIRLAKVLGTDLIQIPTNFSHSKTTGDLDVICADLHEIVQLGLKESPPIRFAYEAVSWGTHIDTWERAWEVVKRVDMPNLGVCLDTFHIAGRVWGDPTSPAGRKGEGDRALATSLHHMAEELDVTKIFYVQSGDAQKLEPPLSARHPWYDPTQQPRMTWSRNARLFAYEEDRGAYLPVHAVLDTIINKLGYRGWISLETFSRELALRDSSIPAVYAKRGLRSWETMLTSLGLGTGDIRIAPPVTAGLVRL